MIDVTRPEWLLLLVPVCGFGVLVVRALVARAAAAATLGVDARTRRRAMLRHGAGAAATVAGLCFGVAALARPVWGTPEGTTRSRGADVVVAVDVSLSMLAEDAKPSRLERAKLVLGDLVTRLDGDRVGLIGFAGSSGILIPLTPDLEAARMFADELQVQSVDEPGTALLRAVTRATELFDAAGQGRRVLVVLSDGEDQSPDPMSVAEQAASLARDADIRVVAVAIGSEGGSTIPLDVLGTSAVKRDARGTPVVTRARRDVLNVLASDGLFLDATRGDEADRIAAFIGNAAEEWERDETRRRRPERFQVPLAIAFLLLALEYLAAAWWR